MWVTADLSAIIASSKSNYAEENQFSCNASVCGQVCAYMILEEWGKDMEEFSGHVIEPEGGDVNREGPVRVIEVLRPNSLLIDLFDI